MDLESLNDLEAKIKEAVSEALPTVKLPMCLILNDIKISFLDVTCLSDKERTYIINSVDANVSLRR